MGIALLIGSITSALVFVIDDVANALFDFSDALFKSMSGECDS